MVQSLPVALFKNQLKLRLKLFKLLGILKFAINIFQNLDLIVIAILAINNIKVNRKLDLVLSGHPINRWAIVKCTDLRLTIQSRVLNL